MVGQVIFAIIPIVILISACIFLFALEKFKLADEKKRVTTTVAGALLASFFFSMIWYPSELEPLWGGVIVGGLLSRFAVLMVLAISLTALVIMRFSIDSDKYLNRRYGVLFLLASVASMVVVTAHDSMALLFSIEIFAVCSYGLFCGAFAKRKSFEGVLKFFILGAVGSALLWFGWGCLSLSSGASDIGGISRYLSNPEHQVFSKVGAVFVLSGIGVKAAWVPFHAWKPDTGESLPPSMVAYFSLLPQVMIWVFAMRFFSIGVEHSYDTWISAFVFIAVTTILCGNALALVQTDVKRLLAYSAIGHSGLLAVFLSVLTEVNANHVMSAMMINIVVYCLNILGVFTILQIMENRWEANIRLNDFVGLYKRNILLALATTIFLMSMVGLPITVGFVAKLTFFDAVLNEKAYGMALLGVLGFVVSTVYLFSIVGRIFAKIPNREFGKILFADSPYLIPLAATLMVVTIFLGTVSPNWLVAQTRGLSSQTIGFKTIEQTDRDAIAGRR